VRAGRADGLQVVRGGRLVRASAGFTLCASPWSEPLRALRQAPGHSPGGRRTMSASLAPGTAPSRPPSGSTARSSSTRSRTDSSLAPSSPATTFGRCEERVCVLVGRVGQLGLAHLCPAAAGEHGRRGQARACLDGEREARVGVPVYGVGDRGGVQPPELVGAALQLLGVVRRKRPGRSTLWAAAALGGAAAVAVGRCAWARPASARRPRCQIPQAGPGRR
jgi:hypothetical protein